MSIEGLRAQAQRALQKVSQGEKPRGTAFPVDFQGQNPTVPPSPPLERQEETMKNRDHIIEQLRSEGWKIAPEDRDAWDFVLCCAVGPWSAGPRPLTEKAELALKRACVGGDSR
jgi:hypothetical protein